MAKRDAKKRRTHSHKTKKRLAIKAVMLGKKPKRYKKKLKKRK